MDAISLHLKNYSDIFSVVLLSLFVSITSTAIASILGIAAGIPVSLNNFKCKKFLIRITDTLMSLPPVLMGLIVYLILSRRGPLGELQLLFTPTAMVIAQTLLIFPIVFGLTISAISKNGNEIRNTCISLGASTWDQYKSIIIESSSLLLSIVTAGFGRAISEVGAVMMVGGNIKGYTRVMTTYIALETGKGNFKEAIIIGCILLIISFLINIILHKLQGSD